MSRFRRDQNRVSFSGLSGLSLIGALLLSPAANAQALLPAPRTVSLGAGAPVSLSGPLAVEIIGCDRALVSPAVERFQRDLRILIGVDQRGASTPMTIRCMARDPAPLSLEAREAYRLNTGDGRVQIDADGEIGVLRALASLRQLVRTDVASPTIVAARIDDAPRFAWRGIMIDTARHFMGVDAVKRQIDAMELTKLNVLHLHLSDSEGFRVESRRFPRLTTVASHGQYYTHDQIRDLVHYAGERGIRIIPEFDFPAHSYALITAYPELAAKPLLGKDPMESYLAALNPASERTYAFLRQLFEEMTALFPDRYVHVGGDEVMEKAWSGSPEIDRFKQKHNLKSHAELEGYFHSRVREILARLDRTTVGWEEIATFEIPNDAVVQPWRTSNATSRATAQGNRVVVSAGFYLDYLRPAEEHYAIEPTDPVAFSELTTEALAAMRRHPILSKIANELVEEKVVARPLPPLTREQERLVIGGEAPLWSELVSEEMLDGRLWPRAAAVAERLWSPAATRDVGDMTRRLAATMVVLRSLGLQDQANRDRMIARLAPDASLAVAIFVEAVAPVRNGAHFNMMNQNLIALADIASTDSQEALTFSSDVRRYLAGDRPRGQSLRARLALWRDNEPAFAAAAKGRPLLEAALPTSKNLARLSQAGLAALAALETGGQMSRVDREAALTVLAELEQQEAASRDRAAVLNNRQPPADLLIRITSDVRRLVDAVRP